MGGTEPSLRELARACLARHRRAARPTVGAGGGGVDRAADWDARAYRDHFEERAGIAEHDGGLSRAEAEARALECAVVEWLNRNPPPATDPDRCAGCGEPLGERDGLPVLRGDGGHIRIHARCYAPWARRRRTEAVVALAAAGLPAPPSGDRER